jgi:hypothetical protein
MVRRQAGGQVCKVWKGNHLPRAIPVTFTTLKQEVIVDPDRIEA